MPDLDRRVGGLRCRDVLALLADFVDGELDPAARQRVTTHLGGCDTCEKFGGEYAALVRALRTGGEHPSEAQPDLRSRLATRLREEWGSDPRPEEDRK